MAAIPPSFQPQEKCNHEIVPHYERKIAQLTAERDNANASLQHAIDNIEKSAAAWEISIQTAEQERDAAIAMADKLAEALRLIRAFAADMGDEPMIYEEAQRKSEVALAAFVAWKETRHDG